MSFWDNFEKNRQLLIAHRGLRSKRPENVMCAFEQVIGKYDMVEFDVLFTYDGVAVVIHDYTLERTSNVKEFKEFTKPYNVVDYTYEQLLKLDFGSWFIKEDPFNGIKKGVVLVEELKKLKKQHLLTLKELLLFLKENNIFANIEIKDLKDTKFHEIAAQEVLKIVDETKMNDKVIISSFNHKYLKQIKRLNSLVETAALVEDNHPKNLINYLQNLNVKNYNPHYNLVNEVLIKELNKAKIFVNVYTVNDKLHMEKLFKWGVKSIFTDF